MLRGDRIRILRPNWIAAPVVRGDLATVESVNAAIFQYKMDRTGQTYTGYVREYDCYELLNGGNEMAAPSMENMVGRKVLVKVNRSSGSLCVAGEIYEIVDQNASGVRTNIDSQPWLDYSDMEKGWELIKEDGKRIEEVKTESNDEQFKFDYMISEMGIKQKLASFSFQSNDAKAKAIMAKLHASKEELFEAFNEFLYDEQYGYIYQAMEEVCGRSNTVAGDGSVGMVGMAEAPEPYIDNGEDNDGYSDDGEESF